MEKRTAANSVLAALAGAVGGALVTLAAQPSAAQGAPAAGAPTAEMIGELRQLRAAIETRLVAAPAASHERSERSPDVPVAPLRERSDARDDARLIAAIERLTATLAASSGAGRPALVTTADASPETPNPAVLALRDRLQTSGGTAGRPYLFASYQRILDEFGTPSVAFNDGSGAFTWGYNFELPNGRSANVHFRFFDGMVIAVTY